jgi:DNA-directed RNA polymerase specialized sigma24 family protein
MSHPPKQAPTQPLQLDQVRQALQRLAPDRVEAFTLRVFGGLSAGEVAQVIGRSEAAVKLLVRQAMRDLQAQLMSSGEREP